MKLVSNGTLGLLVNPEKIDTFVTLKSIDDEINRVNLMDFTPIIRDTDKKIDMVVEPEDYVAYLENRRKELLAIKKEQSEQAKTVEKPKVEEKEQAYIGPTNEQKISNHESSLNIDSPERSKNADLLLELKRKDDIIKRLLTVAKQLKDEQNVGFYKGKLPDNGQNGSIAINGSLRDVLQYLAGNRHISPMGNCAIARGILGDVKAREFIADLYDESTYQSFLDVLGDTK